MFTKDESRDVSAYYLPMLTLPDIGHRKRQVGEISSVEKPLSVVMRTDCQNVVDPSPSRLLSTNICLGISAQYVTIFSSSR